MTPCLRTVVLVRTLCVGAFVASSASVLLAQQSLFSFSGNAAVSQRPFSAEQTLFVNVNSMQPGEELWLQRCGNTRCTVASPVAKWSFDDFTDRSPSRVRTEGARYGFYLYNFGNGNRGTSVTYATTEGAATMLRFESGTSVSVMVEGAL